MKQRKNEISYKLRSLYAKTKDLKSLPQEVEEEIKNLEYMIFDHSKNIETYSEKFKDMSKGFPKDFDVIYYAIDLLSKNAYTLSERIRLNTLQINAMMSQINSSTKIMSELIKSLRELESADPSALEGSLKTK